MQVLKVLTLLNLENCGVGEGTWLAIFYKDTFFRLKMIKVLIVSEQ